MTPDSRELCERASRGDAAAVDDLVARHLPGLEAYVRANLGALVAGKESASDLVQSACREVLSHLDRFRYDGEAGFKRWLYATALRKIQDRHRYYKAEKRDAGRDAAPHSGFAEQLFSSSPSPSGQAAKRVDLERVERALVELPESYRTVIRLAYLEALPHAEVARRMGIREPNARMLLSRALARLARVLSP